MKKMISLRLTIILLLIFSITANAAIWYVHPDSVLNSIQAGIDSCSTSDTVLVTPGTYIENINFNGKAITLKSEQGADTTIIDGGNPANPDSASVVTFISGEDTNSLLDGFTITNGSGTSVPPYGGVGGGIYCYSSSPTITGNTIIGNIVSFAGGGIACLENSSPNITNNIISGDTSYVGGGIECWNNGSPSITDNIISRNSAPGAGGGISCHTSSPTIERCIISDNNGDGIYCLAMANPVINYNNITDNTAFGIQNIDPGVTVNAENNWWGDTLGPGGVGPGSGDEVSDYVDFIPWLTEAVSGVDENEYDENLIFISQNYPNAFMDKTQIEYSLPKSCDVYIAFYNILGIKVRTLLNKRQNAGRYTITWYGRDEKGNKVPSGFYFLRMEAGEYKGTRKLLLIR